MGVDPDKNYDRFPASWLDSMSSALPSTLQQFRRIPTLMAIVRRDIPISFNALNAQKTAILEEIDIYQMRERRALSRLLRKLEDCDVISEGQEELDHAGVQEGSQDTVLSQCGGNVDIATLRQEDYLQIAALNDPTAIFHAYLSYHPSSDAKGYPLSFPDDYLMNAALSGCSVFRANAAKILANLNLQIDDPTMDDLRGLGRAFRCENCPDDMGGLLKWEELVR